MRAAAVCQVAVGMGGHQSVSCLLEGPQRARVSLSHPSRTDTKCTATIKTVTLCANSKIHGWLLVANDQPYAHCIPPTAPRKLKSARFTPLCRCLRAPGPVPRWGPMDAYMATTCDRACGQRGAQTSVRSMADLPCVCGNWRTCAAVTACSCSRE